MHLYKVSRQAHKIHLVNDKGQRLIVLHIGSEDRFVPGGLLCFESKKINTDYHEEMNSDAFFKWMKSISTQGELCHYYGQRPILFREV